jgi:hypothetical protein
MIKKRRLAYVLVPLVLVTTAFSGAGLKACSAGEHIPIHEPVHAPAPKEEPRGPVIFPHSPHSSTTEAPSP